MIKLIDVCKTYTVKGAPAVKALDHVDVEFGEKGLVFILGKSGSGKSTLLNCVGGLDRIDSGEIIIKGKSSKHFSQSEFDSYRNTYLGFIFQEYNILNEFTVAQNIALAFQLQGKKAKAADVDAILEQVDLKGLGKRKPNELSGGQKQRVAIARALIKNPEVILADEPTGALDSATGKAVFDTLRNLSKNHLVIVVSHDRDFAEQYGDRVIEMKDGQIISDISKHQVDPDQISSGVSVVGGKTISIAEGYSLTTKDLKLINEYLVNNKGSTIISMDEKSNEQLRGITRLDKDGKQDIFADTCKQDVGAKEYKESEFKLIRSRLPIHNSMKMAFSSLRVKPFKLFFTMLLSAVALTLFGTADTLASYNKVDSYVNSVVTAGVKAAVWKKSAVIQRTDYSYETEVKMKQADIDALSTEFGTTYKGVLSTGGGGNYYSICPGYNDSASTETRMVYSQSYALYNGFLSGDSSLTENTGFALVGHMPEADDEAVITKYMFDHFKLFGYTYTPVGSSTPIAITTTMLTDDDGTTFLSKNPILPSTDTSYSSSMSLPDMKIVGVLDTQFDLSPYNDIKTTSNYGIGDYLLINQFTSELASGYHGLIYLKQSRIESMMAKTDCISSENGLNGSRLQIGNSTAEGTQSTWIEKVYNGKSLSSAFYFDSAKTTLSGSEFALPISLAGSLMTDDSTSKTAYTDKFGTSYFYKDYGSSFQKNVKQLSLSDYINVDFDYCAPENFITNAIGRYVDTNGLPTDSTKLEALKTRCTTFYSKGQALHPDSGILNWDDSMYSTTDITNHLKAFYAYYLSQDVMTDPYGNEQGQNVSLNIQGGFNNNEFGDTSGLSLVQASMNEFFSIHVTSSMFSNNIYFFYSTYKAGAESKGEQNKQMVLAGLLKPTTIHPYGYRNDNYYHDNCKVYVSNEFYSALSELVETGIFYRAIAPMPTSKDQIRKLVERSYHDPVDNYSFHLENGISSNISMVDSLVSTLRPVLLYVGIAFAIFAALLLATFIGNSVAAKKREIGILRAVGARSADVYGIFFNESEIIAVINAVIGTILTIVICYFANRAVISNTGMQFTLFNFSLRQVGLILAVAVASAAVASFLPSMAISRKKPIDSINNK